ncbi:Histone-lysine N-methyltransferase SETMAR [Eumeta japonica]|uniref:Histone-lysine N-methyltransferase SETMAR n=1 Tax=Eumeta variegata TaxID=151549 RepID=A0A4C1Y206_EUMVA|nr:Histone-lysine N-methyltransferase SETMAR [Eumeta japonica]
MQAAKKSSDVYRPNTVSGTIHYELLRRGKTIKPDLYCQQLIRPKQEVEKKEPELINRKGVVFHHDNARPRKSLATLQVFINPLLRQGMEGESDAFHWRSHKLQGGSSSTGTVMGDSRRGHGVLTFWLTQVFSGLVCFGRSESITSTSHVVQFAVSIGKQASEPSKNWWPPFPMDTRHPREVTSALPASRVGIGHLMEGERRPKREVGQASAGRMRQCGGGRRLRSGCSRAPSKILPRTSHYCGYGKLFEIHST